MQDPIGKMKIIETVVNQDPLVKALHPLLTNRSYGELKKCLDKDGGITEANVYDRFNACWDAFKTHRLSYFQAFQH